ncbi:hypothetical protein RE628_05505 [Paenibacillus sp. D2_2]|uniref:hypothetical protein n=1 Tax=Paenibacillus sp. D2_2 TaxID=3073092 RepID=UPI002815D15A|nr:hypothetical protein [Paenibacillus sp. D2_2]WMT41903.1 hypothetical protein RE628_05505 [Paenibacillus sp. D2_2]
MLNLQKVKAVTWVCLIALMLTSFGLINPQAHVYAQQPVSTQASSESPSLSAEAKVLDSEFTVNLSEEGNQDWIRLGDGYGIKARKAVWKESIQFQTFNARNLNTFDDYIAKFTWNDSTPKSVGDELRYGNFIGDINGGWQLTIPISYTPMKVKVYAGAWGAKGKVEAYFSDGTEPEYVDEFDTVSAIGIRELYTFDVQGDNKERSLIIKSTLEEKRNPYGNISIAATSLWTSGDPFPTMTTDEFVQVQESQTDISLAPTIVTEMKSAGDFDSQPQEPISISATWNMESLEAGKLLTAEVKIANHQKSPQQVLVMMALYDGEGKMEGISYVSRTLNGGSEERLIPGIRLPEVLNGHMAKVMVWEGENLNITTMQPLADFSMKK